MKIVQVCSVLIFLIGCQPLVAQNKLSKKEIKQGWQLLFDGNSTKGWRNFNKQSIGTSWKVSDGTLWLDNSEMNDWQTKDGGDIITVNEYGNFELQIEWKIEPCGNSGILFNVIENNQHEFVWQTGPEMQVLDNTCHPDAKIIKHRAGDLYDLISCKKETVKPAGQWNEVKIRSNNGALECWLNGVLVVSTQLYTPEWLSLIEGSKFSEMAGFGLAKKGHIALQDHGNKVWFRNIKIRELK